MVEGVTGAGRRSWTQTFLWSIIFLGILRPQLLQCISILPQCWFDCRCTNLAWASSLYWDTSSTSDCQIFHLAKTPPLSANLQTLISNQTWADPELYWSAVIVLNAKHILYWPTSEHSAVPLMKEISASDRNDSNLSQAVVLSIQEVVFKKVET